MKKKLLLRSAALSTLLACGAGAQVVNFHDANNGALSFPPLATANFLAARELIRIPAMTSGMDSANTGLDINPQPFIV